MLEKPLRMLPLVLLAGCFATYSQEVFAEDCRRVDEIESYVTSGFAPTGSQCEKFMGLHSSVGVSCFWAHPFRSADADQFFEHVWMQVTTCRQGEAFFEQRNVNHPDSYQQRKLLTGSGIFRVAKKDKGLDQHTLIFLSFEFLGSRVRTSVAGPSRR